MYRQFYDTSGGPIPITFGKFVDDDTVVIFWKRDTFNWSHNYDYNVCVNFIKNGSWTLLPGTKCYNNMVKENRIIKNDYPKDWSRYNFLNVVYQPKNFSPLELSLRII